MSIESDVARHYTTGTLEQRLLDAVKASGKDVDHLDPDDLAPFDEFHSGGRAATEAFAPSLGLRADMHLLDVGAGIGGPARFFARRYGCRVTGIDLTAEFVEVARALTRRVNMQNRVAFEQGSALALPFAAESFDAATMLHVGMNIEDKAALFAEVRRVLKPGGLFGIYDVMREATDKLVYPVPWADDATTSFVESLATYRHSLQSAGFAPEWERSFRDDMAAFFRQQMSAGPAPAAPGVQLLMGASAATRIGNLRGNIEAGRVAPTALTCRAVPH